MSDSEETKWVAIESMWAGLGMFLFFSVWLIGLPAWQSYQQGLTDRAIAHSCANRQDLSISDCVQEYKAALK